MEPGRPRRRRPGTEPDHDAGRRRSRLAVRCRSHDEAASADGEDLGVDQLGPADEEVGEPGVGAGRRGAASRRAGRRGRRRPGPRPPGRPSPTRTGRRNGGRCHPRPARRPWPWPRPSPWARARPRAGRPPTVTSAGGRVRLTSDADGPVGPGGQGRRVARGQDEIFAGQGHGPGARDAVSTRATWTAKSARPSENSRVPSRGSTIQMRRARGRRRRSRRAPGWTPSSDSTASRARSLRSAVGDEVVGLSVAVVAEGRPVVGAGAWRRNSRRQGPARSAMAGEGWSSPVRERRRLIVRAKRPESRAAAVGTGDAIDTTGMGPPG